MSAELIFWVWFPVLFVSFLFHRFRSGFYSLPPAKCVLNVLLLSRDLQPITCVKFCLVIVFGDLLPDLTGFLAVHADLFT